MDTFVEEGNRSIEQSVSESDIEFLTENILFPKYSTSETAEEHRRKKIDEFYGCYQAPDIAKYRGTAWALINAISDYTTHRKQSTKSLMRRTLAGKNDLIDKAIAFLNA